MFGGKKEFNTQDTKGTEKRWSQQWVSSWKLGQPSPFHAIENNRPPSGRSCKVTQIFSESLQYHSRLNHSFRIACQPPPAHSCVSPANACVSCLRKCKSSILSGLPQARRLPRASAVPTVQMPKYEFQAKIEMGHSTHGQRKHSRSKTYAQGTLAKASHSDSSGTCHSLCSRLLHTCARWSQ